MQKKLYFLLIIGFLSFANVNSYGNLGYINTPSAYNLDEGYYSFNFARNKPERRYTLTASPFNWLDASIFYVDITRKPYGGNFKQSYKDKGFSLKISPLTILNHQVAIGLNDLAGTGLFSSEYLVASNTLNNFEYSIGIGWGVFSKGAVIQNPLSILGDRFNNRLVGFRDKGGNFEIDKYFTGKNASLFFGGAYKLSNNISVVFERDPTNTKTPSIPYGKSNSAYNFGISQNFNNFTIKYSFQRGKRFGAQISYSRNAAKFTSGQNIPKKQKIKTYQELQNFLEKQKIGLKSISTVSDKEIEVNVRQVRYFDQDEVDALVLDGIYEIAKNQDLQEIIVNQYYQGMKVTTAKYDAKLLYQIQNDRLANKKYLYIVRDQFPYVANNIYPSIRNFIAGREGFYFGGLFLENDNEIVFKENLILLSNFKYSLWDNFNNLVYPPVDTYPAQVRSDNKNYYNNFNDNIVIGRLEVNYFHSPKKDHFLRVAGGIFEEMFGGIGFDYVYSPSNSILAYGIEGYSVVKREYDMQFKFKSYRNNLIRAAIQLQEPKTNIKFKLSFGEYLAGDIGYTFEAKRSFRNGAEYGIFFSRTNVPKRLFGEGSFDKGIVIRIPFPNIFSRQTTLGRYEWRPLTKDPAALLIKSIDLMEEIERYRFY